MTLELGRLARLAWWMGPWSSPAARPGHVRRRTITLGPGGPSYFYQRDDHPVHAAWLLSPGLHHDGPDDPRMERFAAVLAATGTLVLSPRSPALCQLRLGAETIRFLAHAAEALTAEPLARGLPLHVASVSVGALPALRLAGDPATAARVARLLIIGGYADPIAQIASMFDLDAEPREPLNQAVAFLTFMEDLPVPIHDRDRLAAAWQTFLRIAWARAAWKHPGATGHHAGARAFARDRVDPRDRELFLIGCGALPGGHALGVAAMATGHYDYLDPRPYLAGVRAEVTAIHGRSDAVIPVGQLDALAAGLPGIRAVRLGGFGHSRPVGLVELARQLPRAADELRGFAALLRAMA